MASAEPQPEWHQNPANWVIGIGGLPQHRLTLTATDLGPCWKDVSRAQALSRRVPS